MSASPEFKSRESDISARSKPELKMAPPAESAEAKARGLLQEGAEVRIKRKSGEFQQAHILEIKDGRARVIFEGKTPDDVMARSVKIEDLLSWQENPAEAKKAAFVSRMKNIQEEGKRERAAAEKKSTETRGKLQEMMRRQEAEKKGSDDLDEAFDTGISEFQTEEKAKKKAEIDAKMKRMTESSKEYRANKNALNADIEDLKAGRMDTPSTEDVHVEAPKEKAAYDYSPLNAEQKSALLEVETLEAKLAKAGINPDDLALGKVGFFKRILNEKLLKNYNTALRELSDATPRRGVVRLERRVLARLERLKQIQEYNKEK